ncbi:MAG: tetratricopeptide repeat protein [candidate division KSB1 bacterium]|nr:tetratricopeptide repeat protein [candidate division KSB1 bacterium]
MEKKLLEKECPNDDMLYRYIEGMLNGKERKRIEKHVNQCEHCLHAMAELVKHSLAPADSEEREQLRALGGLTADEQADEVLRWNTSMNQGKAAGDTSTEISFGEKVKSYLDRWMPGIPKPAYVAVGMLILVVAGSVGVRYYNTGYQIHVAKKTLLENHRIYFQDARLSGGYGSSGISMLMGDDDASPVYIAEAKKRLNHAIVKGNDSEKAQRLLAQAYILDNQYDKAEEILSEIDGDGQTSAAVLNDLGVARYRQSDWESAASYFSKAIERDSHFSEARYNLALVYIAQRKNEEAIDILKTLKTVEEDHAWLQASEQLIHQIQK